MRALVVASLSLGLLAPALSPAAASPYKRANDYYQVRDRAQLVAQFKPEDVQVSPQQFAGKLLEVKGVVRAVAGSEDQTTLLVSPSGEGAATYTVSVPHAKLTEYPFLDVGASVRALCKVVSVDGANAGSLELVIPVKEHEAAYVENERARKEAERLKVEAERKAAELRAKTQPRTMASRGVGRRVYHPSSSGGYSRGDLVEIYANAVRYFNRRLGVDTARQIANTIIDYSIKYGLDARLVMAVIAVESNFNANAVSPVGAQGLGQLMPGTAGDLGVANPFDIRANLEGSTRLLSQHIQNMSSDGRPSEEAVKLALACYNAGAGAVRRYKGIPPYRETRNYVKKITRLYRQMCGLRDEQS